MFILLLRKGVYSYEYMNSWKKFHETTLPNKKAFYNKLFLEDITDEDYIHAQVFEKFRDKFNGIYEFDPAHFLSGSELAWQVCLKKAGVKLELIKNNDMLVFIEKRIRGGICHVIHRYAKANNKYMKNYNKIIETSYLMYLDANNLYGWGMFQKLPVNAFKWKKAVSEFDEEFIKSCDEDFYKRMYS